MLEKLKNEEFAVTLISGEGCANCVSMYPMMMGLKEKGIHAFVVEADERNKEMFECYQVSVVPTILITHYGELVSKITGYQPQEIFEIYIESKMEEVLKK